MKLYEVARNTRVRLVGDLQEPPAHYRFQVGDEVLFKGIDGMYSYCINSDGEACHPVAWTEVEVVE